MSAGPLSRRRFIQVAATSVAGVAAASGTQPAFAAGASTRSGREAADLVLTGGQVLLMDCRSTVAEAIAIRGGVVVAAGRSAAMRRWIGRRTTVVDLRGRTALPGINDAHLHGIRTGLALPPYNIDVGPAAVSSIAEIAQAVGAAAAAAAPGSWVRGKGWNQEEFAEGRPPTRQDLDAVAPDNPVALLDWSNHQLWANSRALELAGITATTEPPVGGVIVKDAAGEPTGLLFETAMGLVTQRIPAFTREEQTGALEKNIALALSQGITSYTEPGVGALQRGIYEDLDAAGRLKLRVTALLSRSDDTYPVNAEQVREILAGTGTTEPIGDRFSISGVKLRADGVPIASRTAWMREPYVGGGRGGMVTEGATDEEKVAELGRMIALVHGAGLQIGTHATGDAAIDAVSAAYAAVLGGHDPLGLRHYVIHGDFAWPETLRELAANGCGISFNPNIKHLIADGQPEVVGDVRAAYQTPYASALRAGLNVTSSSDSPNVAPDWRQGLETVLLREGVSGRVSGPEERIDLTAALHTYTTAGAWQDRADDWKGSLADGMAGDVCVLDGRLVDEHGRLAVPAEEISGLGVDLTVVGGNVVFSSEDAAQRHEAAAASGASWATRPPAGSMCAHC
ncbi:amidohydrolase [Modestobacter sp. VKM Ac-2979]|uniref:amidohydrolase n=1 Tax=unclassified Modestobacter TaxID=2643866 RepID=UPI0022AB8F68|nr:MULTISPECIES: amidohydrolase [unclassified Modestobacter]MCZ2811722.1 amidohydrolase [Modestobacter sp. VKM Ac-2979]MCZ2843445.1 amidohydrolase [Modestobacter sp. VKM Ac-2980]